jgi:uncharacterized protein
MHKTPDRVMLAVVNARPIDENLFRITPELRLIGGRSRTSGRIVFPLPRDQEAFEPIELPHRGLLWSYTVQRFPPKSPPYHGDPPFEPFAVGYVELPGALIVESRLTDIRFEEMRIGLPMQLTTVALRKDEHGTLLMFAFRPETGAQP